MKKNKIVTLYKKFLGSLIKKGNKKIAKKNLDNSFIRASKKLKCSSTTLLLKIFMKLNVFIESKSLKNKRRSFIIPFPLKINRRIYLVLKWFTKAVFANKQKIPLERKISIEIYSLLKKKKSIALDEKSLNNKNARLNRSNMHFRW